LKREYVWKGHEIVAGRKLGMRKWGCKCLASGVRVLL